MRTGDPGDRPCTEAEELKREASGRRESQSTDHVLTLRF